MFKVAALDKIINDGYATAREGQELLNGMHEQDAIMGDETAHKKRNSIYMLFD